MRGKKAKLLRRVSRILPEIQVQRWTVEKELSVKEGIIKNTPVLNTVPVNHHRNMKNIYKRYKQMVFVYAYANMVINEHARKTGKSEAVQEPQNGRDDSMGEGVLQPGEVHAEVSQES